MHTMRFKVRGHADYKTPVVFDVTGHPGVALHEPIRTITTKDQWILVDGDRYRPLTLRELARGMGFRDRFRWPANGTRTDTVKALGNAIPPPLAQTCGGGVA